MKRWLKVILFPIVVMIRGYRRVANRPAMIARRLFAYDCKRFVRYAGCFNDSVRGASLARIIMAYHVLEKGMTMPRRRLDFGHAAVLNLIGLIRDFENRFGFNEDQVNHAVGCVKEYLELHVSAVLDTGKDDVFWSEVKSFCREHEDVPASKQMEMTREQFFANNEDSFPVFAASRHTSRHYEGVVDIGRIKTAVQLAMTAPSACNRQFVKVYCVSNHETRDKLLSLQNGNRGFGKEADKLLVVTADMSGNRWVEERNDLYTNAGIFTMNLAYALQYNRVAHCILNWSVSPENDVEGHKILGMPENEAIVVLLSCGNAPERFMIAASPRKCVEEVFSEIR